MTGTVVTRETKKGKRYYAVWRVHSKQKWKAFTKKGDAERYLTTVVKSVHDGTFQEVQPLDMAAVFDRWLENSLDLRLKQGLLKPSTAKSYRSMMETHLRSAFGPLRSDRLSPADVAAWVKAMAEEIAEGNMSPKFYNNLLNLFHSILAWAKHPAQGYLVHDPLIGQKRLPRPRVERDYLEPEEIAVLLKGASAPDNTILHLAVYGGLRRGELFGLQWGDIDWGMERQGGRLHVRRSLYQGAVTSPKTESSYRVVDITQSTLDRLLVDRELYPPIGKGYIFRTAKGTPMDPDHFYSRRFLPLLEAVGLRKVGLHALRHTYASLLINQGESIKYVSRQLGHASIQITADLYGHLFKETSVSAMERLEKRITDAAEEKISSNIHLTERQRTP